MSVEVESDGAVEVGAVGADSSGLEACEDLGFGKAEGSVESDGNHGEGGSDRC